MPVTPTYPGVYIEEVASGVRTITGVATSITAFVGYFSRGPFREATRLLGYTEFERTFGGLRANSEASYAIAQFFANGGGQAFVVRTALGAEAKVAAFKLTDGAADVAQIDAVSPGTWAHYVRVEIDHATLAANTFNLTVREMVRGNVVAVETYRGLTLDAAGPNFAPIALGGSKLIRLKTLGTPTKPPAASGTISRRLLQADLAGIDWTDSLTVEVGATSKAVPGMTAPSSLADAANKLQAAIRAADPAFAAVTVSALGDLSNGGFLRFTVAGDDPARMVEASGDLTGAAGLGLSAANPPFFALGAANGGTMTKLTDGVDGGLPDAAALIAALQDLERIDLFNILSVPDTVRLDANGSASVAAAATAYAAKRRAFYILDLPHPSGNPIDTVAEAETWIQSNGTLRHKNAATYFPRPLIADPLADFRLRATAPSGTMAGVYARTDAERGVWKAPAGTDAVLRNVLGLEYGLSDDENGVLNPLAVNCLRNLTAYGMVSWGARTLDGNDQKASEWKYVPVRRLALFLEESLYRGTQWVVFEPNDEPLWAQIRLNIGAFLHGLFRQGAFQGTTPREAYLVRCDRTTTTQDDINRGVVNIVVGFAPLKPAEFVILQIQQLAGQVQA